jgi:hypothetical protein
VSTFGNTNTETGVPAGTLHDAITVAKFTLSEAGTATLMSFLIANPSGPGFYFKPVIYAADGAAGAPSTLVYAGDPISVASSFSKGWKDSAAFSQALAAGDYWLGMHCDVNGYHLVWYLNSSGGAIQYKGYTYTSGVPNPHPGSPEYSGSEKQAVYVTYTASGAGNPYYAYAQQ